MQQPNISKKNGLECPPPMTKILDKSSLLAPSYVPLNFRQMNKEDKSTPKQHLNTSKKNATKCNHQETKKIDKSSLLAPNYVPQDLKQFRKEDVPATAQQVSANKSASEFPSHKTKGLVTTSLLAPNYVPLDLRRHNFRDVTTYLKAKSPLGMHPHIQRVYSTAVTMTHKCTCGENHNPPSGTINYTAKTEAREASFALGLQGKNRGDPNFKIPAYKTLDKMKGKKEYYDTIFSLLREEHKERLILYERYSQYNAQIKVFPGVTPQASIPVHGIFDARPPLKSGDTVLLRSQRPVRIQGKNQGWLEYVEIQAKVVKTSRGKGKKKDRVIFTWVDPFHAEILANESFAVRFLPSTDVRERCYIALNWLYDTIDPDALENVLFPFEAPSKLPKYSPLKDDQDEDLNEKQASFVKMVLTRTVYPSKQKVRSPMILTGPAGTGKTRALLVSIRKALNLEADHKKRILVCTPSHTSADLITRRLGEFLSAKKLYRLYDSTRRFETVPVDMLQFSTQGPMGEFILPPASELLDFEVIVCTCIDAQLLYLAGINNRSLRTRRKCLQNYIQTSLQASNMTVTGEILGLTETHFTHLFIDEAAQATEPETLIPLAVVMDDQPGFVKVEIVLAGDPRQLTPEIFSPWATDGLQKSLLERLLQLPLDHLGGGRAHLLGPPTKNSWTNIDELMEYAFYDEDDKENLSVFLTTSYRGHPSLLLMPSKLFYFDKLQSAPLRQRKDGEKWCSVLRKIEDMSAKVNPSCEKQSSWPIHFRAVVGLDKSTAVKFSSGVESWCNHEEAAEVMKITSKLVQEGVKTQSIGIMAPFRAQVDLIRRLLREQNLGMVNVGLVEDFQAVEQEVIVLSLTRSTEDFLPSDFKRRVGLFNQPKRTNVALTRAENLLVVVGSPLLMEKDKIWREWLIFCYKNGLCYGEGTNAQFTIE